MEENEVKEFNAEKCEYGVTDHCLQRYAERVRGLQGAGTDPDGKLTKEIKMLFMSSKAYYTGQIGKPTNIVTVYINRNGWTFIADDKTKALITLYKVDLNVDSDEINQMYVDKALNKITSLAEEFEKAEFDAELAREKYTSEIAINDNKIKEYKDLIKSLENRNTALKEISRTETSKPDIVKAELKSAVEDFMIKDKSKLEG